MTISEPEDNEETEARSVHSVLPSDSKALLRRRAELRGGLGWCHCPRSIIAVAPMSGVPLIAAQICPDEGQQSTNFCWEEPTEEPSEPLERQGFLFHS